MKYAFYEWDLGYIKLGYEENVLFYLGRTAGIDCDNKSDSFTDDVFAQLQEYFEGKRTRFDFPYELRGTEFQKKVWNALCEIPYGETRSYKDIAVAIGNPKACRAVGMANNRNPISIVVPCHRVIGSDGKMVGYGGGLDMKEKLLKLESRVVS